MGNTINSLGINIPTLSSGGSKPLANSDFAATLLSAKTAGPSLAKAPGSHDAATDDLAQSLRLALRKQGINVPPNLRIETDSQGLLLRDDPRNAHFQAMLAANPSLQSQIGASLAASTSRRAAALAAAGDDFLKGAKDPRRAQAVLDRYLRDHPTPAISASYDGFTVSAQEQSAEGWRPLKTEREFAWELAVAYQRYAVDDEALFNSLMQAVSSKGTTAKQQDHDAKPTEKTAPTEAGVVSSGHNRANLGSAA